ncbi:hypothetical protein NM208_g2594 [Fusarium decemcellulare]|uniref:Uncharacterized protein n=2 Tax=Fusarium decemcellulare TaxID=57161 RepID=A0ACC1SKI0_9HYPO|nr:hypothetical protein NM208_g4462 [Fusarium decemcellulare]KAJ3545271.1 hypothetical protein NM208_g2594 [Fusarium decemcellulare]
MVGLDKNADLSIRNQWARQHAVQAIKHEWNKVVDRNKDSALAPIPRIPDQKPLPKAPRPPKASQPGDPAKAEHRVINIGIVGAGAAGLFTALVLHNLNDELRKKSLPLAFDYDMYEAAGPERVGGRLFTYNFGGAPDVHDYYDVGAMRFPHNPVMKRVFELFHNLDMKEIDLEKHPDAKDGHLITYYMQNGGPDSKAKQPWCYNDITAWGSSYSSLKTEGNDDPFQLAADGNTIMKANIAPLREALKKDAEQNPPGESGWKLLMEYDTYSTRQFLGTAHPEITLPDGMPPPPYNYSTIEWLETFNGGTDWYDQAHSETVLESLDFEFFEKTKWSCVMGGAQQLAKRMEGRIKKKPRFNSPVTAIRALDKMKVELDIRNEDAIHTKSYNAVFNTTTLGCLQRIDTRQAGLRYPIKQAIRSLGYGTSCKVAIKFNRAWWIHDLKDYNIKQAGLGHSDLSLRTCVYPSYNIYDDPSKSAVLLCSYTWQQDSDRLGSLMSTNPNHAEKVADEAALKELLLRELAILHKNPEMSEEDLYKLIKDSYVDHHAWNWSTDPNTAGAFAFFRPQQFTSMWNKLIQPSGDVIIVGEAASPHHAWVVGALESVIHGLHAWMGANTHVHGMQEARDILAKYQEGNPFVGLPPYMDENMSQWHSMLGMVHRDEHLKGLDSSGDAKSPASLLSSLDFEAFHSS